MKKYEDYRSEIKNGDIMLFRGEKPLSKLIQKYDNAYYNHAGLIFESNNRLLVLDSNAFGVNPEILSDRLERYTDFCIIRPVGWNQVVIDNAVSESLKRAEKHIKYDVFLLLEIAIERKTRIEVDWDREDKDICSEFARRYTRYLDQKPICYEQPNLPTNYITPWDFIIYANEDEFEILFDDCNRSLYRKK